MSVLASKSLKSAVAIALAGVTLTLAIAPAEAGWRHRRGAHIGAGIIGGLALGALAAHAYRPAYGHDDAYCYKVRRRVWSDWHGAYIVRRVTVCE